MGLPADVKLSLTNSNYWTLGEPDKALSKEYYKKNAELENLISGRVAINMPILEGATLSMDVGAAITTKFDDEIQESERSKTLPYSEIKYKQDFAKVGKFTFRGYGRQRIKGESVQERISAGVSYKINDKLSVCTDGHYTIKFSDDKLDQKAGFWVSANYSPFENFIIWGDVPQVNRNLNKKYFNNPNDSGWRVAFNFGVSYRF